MGHKDKIKLLDRTIDMLSDEVEILAVDLPTEAMGIVDKVNANIAELKEMAESMRQTGYLDAEVLDFINIDAA